MSNTSYFVVNRHLRQDVFNPDTGDRLNVPNIAIVITDGHSNVDSELTLRDAKELQEYATVYVVGVTNQIKIAELEVRRNVFFGSV